MTREKSREIVLTILEDLYYCGRVWEAWDIGTMSKDDFILATEYDELIEEKIDKLLEV